MDGDEILWWVGFGLLGLALYKAINQPAYANIQPSSPQTPDVTLPALPSPSYGSNATSNSQQGTQTIVGAMPNSVDLDIMTRTILGEARNQGEAGMEAVANVIINRYHDGGYPGAGSIAGICKAPYQFSCWGPLNSPAAIANNNYIKSVQSNNPLYQQAYSIAQRAVAGTLNDNTDGATYYHEASIATPQPPHWPVVTETAEIGTQIFYAVSEG